MIREPEDGFEDLDEKSDNDVSFAGCLLRIVALVVFGFLWIYAGVIGLNLGAYLRGYEVNGGDAYAQILMALYLGPIVGLLVMAFSCALKRLFAFALLDATVAVFIIGVLIAYFYTSYEGR